MDRSGGAITAIVGIAEATPHQIKEAFHQMLVEMGMQNRWVSNYPFFDDLNFGL